MNKFCRCLVVFTYFASFHIRHSNLFYSAGDDMFTKLNGSVVPTSLSDLHGGNLNVSFSASTDVPQCMARCQRNERCTAFTFRYDKNRCWLQTSEAPEVVYQLFQVDVNVSSYVKDGYACKWIKKNAKIGTPEGPSMLAVKAKIYERLYKQSSAIAFDETSSYWSALKSS